MQGVNLRTSVGILVTVKIVAGCFISLSVSSCPSVGVVSGLRVSLVLRVVNGQVERVGAFAAVSIAVVVGVVAAGVVGRAVPHVAFAFHHRFGIVCAVVDGQMESDGAVGVVNGLEVLHIVTAGGVNGIVPGVRLASGGGEFVGGGVVDSEVQGIDLRTSVGIRMAVNVVARSGVCLIVTICPSVGVVGDYRVCLVTRFVDGEMQGHHAVAAVGGLKRNGGLVSAFGVGHIVNPGELLAGGLLVNARGRHVHGHVHGFGIHCRAGSTVDSLRGGSDNGVFAALYCRDVIERDVLIA